MKKITFQDRLEAINWIAENAKNEGQFEVLREQLNFNYIYTGGYFIEIDALDHLAEVVFLDRNPEE